MKISCPNCGQFTRITKEYLGGTYRAVVRCGKCNSFSFVDMEEFERLNRRSDDSEQ